MTPKKIIEEIKQDKRIGGLRFTDDGVVLLPSGLRMGWSIELRRPFMVLRLNTDECHNASIAF